MSKYKCRICGTEDNEPFVAREMMFGTREEFEYFQCRECRTIQIAEIPQDLSKYYPPHYNAYEKRTSLRDPWIKSLFKRYLAKRHLSGRHNALSRWLAKRFGLGFLKNLEYARIDLDSKILDVGCGMGHRLVGLRKYGFTNLTGIDPYIERDVEYPNGVRLYKQSIFEHRGIYDFIMLNHVFEHVEDPYRFFEALTKRIRLGGVIFLSMPVADSYSWQHYREHWVALDPPRHLHIFTKKSLERVVGRYGYTVSRVIYESNEYQFWASEQYKRGIPLRSPQSYYENPAASIFSAEEIAAFRRRAEQLNKEGLGDVACFVVEPKGGGG